MNIIVLFSLILVAGILVDGVIVTTEHADRKISLGYDRRAAYLEGAVRMSWPIVASTVTTLMVFFPLLVWPGIVGQFMKYLPITMIVVLSASLLMALIFIPILGSLVGKVSTNKRANTTPPKFYKDILKKVDDSDLNVYQILVKEYLNIDTPYRGLLVYHGLGTGKSASAISTAENLSKDLDVRTLLPASLEGEFIKEIKISGKLVSQPIIFNKKLFVIKNGSIIRYN